MVLLPTVLPVLVWIRMPFWLSVPLMMLPIIWPPLLSRARIALPTVAVKVLLLTALLFEVSRYTPFCGVLGLKLLPLIVLLPPFWTRIPLCPRVPVSVLLEIALALLPLIRIAFAPAA